MITTPSIKRRERKRNHTIMFGIVVLAVLALLGGTVNSAHAITIEHNGIGGPPFFEEGSGEVNVKFG